jgi:hypothetical protein
LAGKCLAIGQRPSLAREITQRKPTKIREVITDPLEMISFLSFRDPDRLFGKEKLPSEIVAYWPGPDEFSKYFLCRASNCRSAQKKCDQYE